MRLSIRRIVCDGEKVLTCDKGDVGHWTLGFGGKGGGGGRDIRGEK